MTSKISASLRALNFEVKQILYITFYVALELYKKGSAVNSSKLKNKEIISLQKFQYCVACAHHSVWNFNVRQTVYMWRSQRNHTLIQKNYFAKKTAKCKKKRGKIRVLYFAPISVQEWPLFHVKQIASYQTPYIV